MIAVDTNLLIYAHRAETRLHVEARATLIDLAENDRLWALPVFCLAEFVRVVTHLRVFTPPSDLATALDFLDRVLASPSLRLLLPSPGYPDTLRRVCESGQVRGNLAFDAQIAAVCHEHGVTELISTERDFARFDRINVRAISTSVTRPSHRPPTT